MTDDRPPPDSSSRPRVAVVGSGIAGLTAAWLLQRRYRVDLIERNETLGGHTRTLQVPDGPDAGTPVDTGFIVHNDRNYPILNRLFDAWGVERADSDMSFSYTDLATQYCYAGSSFGTLFARKRSLLSPRHHKLILDILRFNKLAKKTLQGEMRDGQTLGDWLREHGFGGPFVERYLAPMGAAIWSASNRSILGFPARAYMGFFRNHGLLDLKGRPQWRYIPGGSASYIRDMLQDFSGGVRCGQNVTGLTRTDAGVRLEFEKGDPLHYDYAVLATHADQALRLLQDPSPEEQRLLSPWTYQPNTVVLHTDASVMPPRQRAWASWNVVREPAAGPDAPVSVSYHMNRLQRLQTTHPYFVTLNRSAPIPGEHIIDETVMTHPGYTPASMATQPELPSLNGKNRTWFCGSYFGYGFHEDAARSGVEAARSMGVEW